jgi:hypothetical protein
MKIFFFLLFASLSFAQGWYYGGGVPSINFVASTTTDLGRTGNGDIVATLPTGWAVGNVAVMIVYNDQGDASTPTNWTEITGSPFGAGTEKMCVFVKTLWTGNPSATTTISGSGTNIAHQAGILVYANVDTTTPISVIGTVSNGTGTPVTAGAITTTSAGQVVIGLLGRGDNDAAQFSSETFNASGTGVAERMDVVTAAGNDANVGAYDKTIATTSTSSGNGSATAAVTDPWVSVIIGLKLK